MANLLRLSDVIEAVCLSKPTIYRLIKDRGFPQPVRIGPRAVRWRADEIDAWVEGRPRATGDGPRGSEAA